MLKVKVNTKFNFPTFAATQERLEFAAQRIIIPDIVRGIHARRAITGGNLPENEPATIKRKGNSRTLIETGKLLASFFFVKRGKSKVIIGIQPIRHDVGRYLQIEGISTKKGKKFYRFFGISENAERTCFEYMKKAIKEMINARK